ncbi:EamA family transporter [Conexibacter woesei]|uniref:EamA family transporter n=1 Tax=Conexibacter woesei TaxID=191495 RepID=UPI0005557643|nr:EamA family transporter [Conexibacter woesei]
MRVWAALGAIYLIWGSTYLAIRVMVETVPPALGAGVRFLIAGGAMLAFLLYKSSVRVTRAQLGWCLVVGSLLAAGGNGLVTVAERDVPSGLAALLIASEPLIIVLLRGVTGDRPDRATLGGVALGFVGVGILMLPGGRPDDVPLGMTLLVIVAAFSWALGSFISPRVDLPKDPLLSTAWSLLLGGGILTIGGLLGGEGGDVDVGAFSAKSLAALAYLVVVGSIVAFTAYSWLLSNAPISRVSTYAYVNPVIAVALGALFLSESVAAATVAGMALVIASVVVIVRREAVATE